MPAHIEPSEEVRTFLAADGTTQVRCPACYHFIPNVPKDALTTTEHRPTADTIACACRKGLGTNIVGYRVVCDCRAVFRLQPQGSNRYVVAEGWQEARPQILADSVDAMAVEPESIIRQDRQPIIVGQSLVAPKKRRRAR